MQQTYLLQQRCSLWSFKLYTSSTVCWPIIESLWKSFGNGKIGNGRAGKWFGKYRLRDSSNLERVWVVFWTASGWITVGPLSANCLLAIFKARRTYLTESQRGTKTSQQLANLWTTNLCYPWVIYSPPRYSRVLRKIVGHLGQYIQIVITKTPYETFMILKKVFQSKVLRISYCS